MKTAAIKFGPLAIHWYGVLIALALVVGLGIAIALARLRGERADPLAGILLLGLMTGMIGARVWYFVFNRDFYNADPGRVFAVWQGGLALHGALVGAILSTLIYTWNAELDFWTWADICVPALILGQALGRIGDLLNHQAFGAPSNGHWTVSIPIENRPLAYQGYSHFTPTAGYEAIWDLLVFAVLIGLTFLQLRRIRALPAGSIFLAYLVLYSVGRIPLESMRLDSLWVANMRVAQLASGVLIVAGALLYLVRLLQALRPAAAPLPVAAPYLTGPAGETYLQPSEAYLVAATRAAQVRLQGGTAEGASAITKVLTIRNGHAPNGHMPDTAALPVVPVSPVAQQVDAAPTAPIPEPDVAQAEPPVRSDVAQQPEEPPALNAEETPEAVAKTPAASDEPTFDPAHEPSAAKVAGQAPGEEV